MSVSQVKKKFEEMSQYLNRDVEGQKRLKELKDSVNVLRTSLAEATKAVETSSAIVSNARLRADTAETETKRLELENAALRSTLQSRDYTIQQLTAKIHDLEAGPEEFRLFQDAPDRTAAKLLSNIKRTHRTCPKFARFTQLKEPGLALYLEDFVRTFSYQELWSLGAVVALFSMLGEAVFVVRNFESPVRKLPTLRERAEHVFGSERAAAFFADWFRNNLINDADKTEQERFELSATEKLRTSSGAATMLPRPDCKDPVSCLFPEDEL